MTEDKLEKINELKDKLDNCEYAAKRLKNREKGDKISIHLEMNISFGGVQDYDLTSFIDDSLLDEIEIKVRHNIIDKFESLKKEFESL